MSALDEYLDYLVALAQSAGPSPFAYGTVATVGAGTPPVVTVNLNGTVVPVLCPKHWTTTDIVVGDQVVMTPPPLLRILQAY